MGSPLQFVESFRRELRRRGIPYGLTSRFACVHFGVQQTTKDSDWIIPASSLAGVHQLFLEMEGALPRWRISYRSVCGAPLGAEFLGRGWTSHLAVWDSPDSPEHHVDFFSAAPRVAAPQVDDEGWCSRDTVARMKRTDRDRDWPVVDSLARQMASNGDGEALVHLQDANRLIEF